MGPVDEQWKASRRIPEARYDKTDLKVFVVVIPKEGLVGWGAANPSFGMTPTIASPPILLLVQQ